MRRYDDSRFGHKISTTSDFGHAEDFGANVGLDNLETKTMSKEITQRMVGIEMCAWKR